MRWTAAWGDLRVVEPTAADVDAAAPRLCAFYNEPHNRAMLAHDDELTVADVVAHYARLAVDGRAFLLEAGGALAGDADLRHLAGGAAECAILVGDRAAQGRGLGTRFLAMVHALAFGPLALERVYATIIPGNAASLALFRRLGYEVDDTPAARAFVDAADDVTLSIARAGFLARHADAVAAIRLAPA